MSTEVMKTKLFIHMNNWLSNQVGLADPTQAEAANDVDFLVERANECWSEHGKRPTFYCC